MTAARSVLTRTRTVSTIYPKTSRNTVVTLLGWAYGRDENLAKYSQIYENRGFTTLRFTAQFAGHTRNLKCSRNVSGVIDSIQNILSESDKRLSLHLLSMNGVYTLCSLLLQYPELNILNRTSGIVFDSCPIYFDSTSASAFGELADTFAAKTLSSGRPVEIAMYRLWKAYFMLNVRIAVYELLLYSKVGFDLTNISPYHFVREHPLLPHNLAFIYSDKDTICPAHSIEAFHRTMSEMGKNVISHRFIDSPHVEHFKKYPKEYESIVDQYLGFLEN